MPSPLGYTSARNVSLTGENSIDSLLAGVAWGSTGSAKSAVFSLTYSFVTPDVSEFVEQYSGSNEYLAVYSLSAAQKKAIAGALGAWSAVANLSFSEVKETSDSFGDLRFGGYSYMDDSTAAWAYFPGESPASGDVWIGKASREAKPVAGSYDYMTFMHEIGHALGLKHPFSTLGDNQSVLPDELNDIRYTLMSYNNVYYNASHTAYVEPSTPMLLDIQAMQQLYGANMTWHSGNDTYSWKPGQVVFETLWDAGGIDTIDASNQKGAVQLNLNEGEFSSIGAAFYDAARLTLINNGLAIAYGAKIENATGSAYADTLIGNDLDNVLDGRGGADVMRGGLGNDTYIVDNLGDVVIEDSALASEIDTVQASVSYTLGANLEVLTLTGRAAINGSGNALDNIITGNAGSNELDGGAGNDSLYGGAGNDRLLGGSGNDLLDGGAGIDQMSGGTGDDIYYVDNLRDQVTELSGEGHDLVRASVSYTLAKYVEDGELLGKANLNLTGNELANVLTGNSGANILRGMGGADTLIGGLGNDTYYVDSVDARIIESGTSAKEIDNVFASVDWTLSANLENLTLTGSAAIGGTGNELNNRITGNAGDNVLDGGAGADTLVGGLGNDTYIVDNVHDVIIETSKLATEIDTVRASVDWTLGANLENLVLTGSGNLNGIGNALNNLITGNAGNNLLDGGAGNDVLNGGAGNDVLIGGLGSDTLSGGAGADTFVFNSLKEMAVGVTRDVIRDFNSAEGDRIDLSKIDANLLLKGLNGFTFIGSDAFTGAGQLRFENEILSGNVDGKLAADFEIQLVGVTSFSANDLVA